MDVENLLTSQFDYPLPEELIASRPLERRDDSRMMIVHRTSGVIEHRHFKEFPGLAPDHLLVLNNARVARARYFSNDGRIELLRLQVLDACVWNCFVKPGRKMRVRDQIQIGHATGTVEQIEETDGSRRIHFDQPVDELGHGHLPLPHYMKRSDDASDDERYQTVFSSAQKQKAIAAPTAGLHFTPEILNARDHAFITLDVGVGTFQPVRAEKLKDHQMHTESFEIEPAAAGKIHAAHKILAVGTTVTRVLEHQMAVHGDIRAEMGETNIFLYPGCSFRKVNALLTNFHLPKSTLFMLVCAFAGKDLTREAYRQAVAQRYRFYSYGDCMIILE